MGTANDVVGQEEAGVIGGAEMGAVVGGSAKTIGGSGVVVDNLAPVERAAPHLDCTSTICSCVGLKVIPTNTGTTNRWTSRASSKLHVS